MGWCHRCATTVPCHDEHCEWDPNEFPDDPIKCDMMAPKELGWVFVGDDTYLRPDGSLYVFPPYVLHQVVVRHDKA